MTSQTGKITKLAGASITLTLFALFLNGCATAPSESWEERARAKETSAFAEAKSSGSAASLQGFLRNYPSGPYSWDAKQMLSKFVLQDIVGRLNKQPVVVSFKFATSGAAMYDISPPDAMRAQWKGLLTNYLKKAGINIAETSEGQQLSLLAVVRRESRMTGQPWATDSKGNVIGINPQSITSPATLTFFVRDGDGHTIASSASLDVTPSDPKIISATVDGWSKSMIDLDTENAFVTLKQKLATSPFAITEQTNENP